MQRGRQETGITTFGEDVSGELYLATEGGTLARIQDSNPIVLSVASLDSSTGSARGGESVVIVGSGFFPDSRVSFGGVDAPSVSVLDSDGTRLLVVTPAHGVGSVDVVVTKDGLPVGLMLVGRHFEEARLIQTASAFEARKQ